MSVLTQMSRPHYQSITCPAPRQGTRLKLRGSADQDEGLRPPSASMDVAFEMASAPSLSGKKKSRMRLHLRVSLRSVQRRKKQYREQYKDWEASCEASRVRQNGRRTSLICLTQFEH
ncbi:hypothetical protein BV25DRAFT_1831645 [Artomyces pyxidatus]|uniref:Uncharacterized protein n=1 Tax=Artomyces pyxidatus TaxID=48021 RepID=A0ACB8SL57_9AGAM|nr:hypothetical protein BV25DRAFT_1831645 [Artomyces pyxidatus]